jgi:hypothetical protein
MSYVIAFLFSLLAAVRDLFTALWEGLGDAVQLHPAVTAAVLLVAVAGVVWLERRQLRRVWARVQARAARAARRTGR